MNSMMGQNVSTFCMKEFKASEETFGKNPRFRAIEKFCLNKQWLGRIEPLCMDWKFHGVGCDTFQTKLEKPS